MVDGRGPEGVEQYLEQADAIADELAAYRGRVADLDADGLLAFMLLCPSCTTWSAGPRAMRRCRSASTRPTPSRGALMQRVEERGDVDRRPSCCSSSSSGPSVPDDAGRGAARRRPPRRSARHHLRIGPPLPAAPAHRARGDGAHREVGHRPRRVGAPVRRAARRSRVDLDGAHDRRSRQACAGSTTPTASVAGGRGGASPPASRPGSAHAGLRLQHAAARQGDRRPPARYSTWIASRNLANEASDESVAGARRGGARPLRRSRSAGTALKAQLLGLDRLADYDRMASVGRRRDRDRLGRGDGRSCSTPTSRSRPSSPTLAGRFFDERWIDAPVAARQAPGRVLRLHGAVAPPVRAAQLDRRAAATCSRSPTSSATACTRTSLAEQGDLPPDDAADARRDRVGVRRDGDVRPAARRIDRSRLSGSRCSRRTSRTRSRRCSARSR